MTHESEVMQAESARKIEMELAVVFAGQVAQKADKLQLGANVMLEGFLAPRRRQSRTLVLNVTEFEMIEA